MFVIDYCYESTDSDDELIEQFHCKLEDKFDSFDAAMDKLKAIEADFSYESDYQVTTSIQNDNLIVSALVIADNEVIERQIYTYQIQAGC